jgi:CRISPR-associated endonuclease/helicase Cas3
MCGWTLNPILASSPTRASSLAKPDGVNGLPRSEAKTKGEADWRCAPRQGWPGRRFKGGFNLSKDRELAPDPVALAQTLKRVSLAIRAEPSNNADIVNEIAAVDQALVIVNSRRHALDLYGAAKDAGLTDVVHLTTRQTAADRRRKLATIRENLKAGRTCRVIATSLVEAGVDLDFPRVWRAQAGLDQIAQAAGRCNREGRRPLTDSIVTVFTPAEAKPPPEIKPFIEAMRRVIPHYGDLFSPDAIQRYFQEVHWQKRLDQITIRDAEGSSEKIPVLESFLVGRDVLDFPYRAIGEGFRLIESGMEPRQAESPRQAWRLWSPLGG